METRGRPYCVAILGEERNTITIREMFFRICRDLTPEQSKALARALFIRPLSVRQHYKTGRAFPGLETALRVIEWDKRGRPLEKRKCSASYM